MSYAIHISHRGQVTYELPKSAIGHALAKSAVEHNVYGPLYARHQRDGHVEYEYARGRIYVHDDGTTVYRRKYRR